MITLDDDDDVNNECSKTFGLSPVGGRSPSKKIPDHGPSSSLAVVKNETTLSLSVGKSDLLYGKNLDASLSMGVDDSAIRLEVLEELNKKVDHPKLPAIDLD